MWAVALNPRMGSGLRVSGINHGRLRSQEGEAPTTASMLPFLAPRSCGSSELGGVLLAITSLLIHAILRWATQGRSQLEVVVCVDQQVAWHPTKPTLLASSSMDGSVVAFQTDGSKVQVLQQASGASGCAWARDGYLLATTSEAGAVHV